MSNVVRRADLIEPELSYRIVGVLFDIYNNIGPGYQERVYQRAAREALQKTGLRFQEQVPCSVEYDGKMVGRYLLDFLIENRVILELKQGKKFLRNDFNQVTAYLQATGLPLAILAHFGTSGVTFRRVLKPIEINHNHS